MMGLKSVTPATFATAALGGLAYLGIRQLCESFDALRSMTQTHKEDVARSIGAIVASTSWSATTQNFLISAIAAELLLRFSEVVEPDETFRTIVLFGAHVTFQALVFYRRSIFTSHPSYRRTLNAFSKYADDALARPHTVAKNMVKLARVSVVAGSRFAALSLAIKCASCLAKQRSLPPARTLAERAASTTVRTALYTFSCASIVSIAGHLRVSSLATLSAFSLVLAQPRSKWRSYLQLIYTHWVYSLFFAPLRLPAVARRTRVPLIALDRGAVRVIS